MKIFILILLFSFNSLAHITVISDLDDTIKITNAGDLGDATWNGVFTEKVFTGMPEFLKETKQYSESLYVVSAGPKLIKGRVLSLLKKFGIKHDGVYLRAIPGREGKFDFKLRTIVNIIEKVPGDILLLGDDVDLDPEVYAEITNRYPERVLGVYIRSVKNRKIPDSFNKFWTSFDLALNEHIAGRLDNESVQTILDSVLKETRLNYIIPGFADCPTSSVVWEWQLSTMFSAEALVLAQKLNQFCMKGKHLPE